MIDFKLVDKVSGEFSEDFFRAFIDNLSEVLKEKIEEKIAGQIAFINLILCDDSEIQALNEEYRKKNKATDVLSFPYWDSSPEGISVGEIFVSIETARKQAEEKGHDLEKEMAILFVHGLLHLFGFDHNNDEEEQEMERYASMILE